MRAYFLRAAQQAAQSTPNRITALEREIAEIEDKKDQLHAKCVALRGSLQRLANYTVTDGTDYFCPVCWVDDGKMSPLSPIGSETRDDIFRCRVCHWEAIIPG